MHCVKSLSVVQRNNRYVTIIIPYVCDIYYQGEFLSTVLPNIKSPYHSSPLPSAPRDAWVGPKGKMLYLLATEYVVNTAAVVYQRIGMLRFDVKPDSVRF